MNYFHMGIYMSVISTFINFFWSFSEIFMLITESSKLVCNNEYFIKISTWLIINCVISFSAFYFNFAYIYPELREYLPKKSYIICNLLVLIWSIIGSIMVVKECGDSSDASIRVYVWFSVIFGYILFINILSVYYISKRIDRYNSEPLIII